MTLTAEADLASDLVGSGFADLTRVDPQELAARAGAELEGAPPLEVLRWAVDRFSPRFAITASMQDTVLLHMAAQIRPGISVIFLDTGFHFAETIGTADAAEAVYGIDLIRVRPSLSVEEQDARYGPRLYERNPDLCCQLRKVRPLQQAMRQFDAWASGVRRDEADTRRSAKLVEWDERRSKIKINPLVAWTQQQIDDYIAEHGVLMNPLLSEGYGSVGCAPCTRPGSGRAGRWEGQAKVECGLHL